MARAKPLPAAKAKVPPPAVRVSGPEIVSKSVLVPSVLAMLPPFQVRELMVRVPTGSRVEM